MTRPVRPWEGPPGSGIVARRTTADPRKSTAARRPNSRDRFLTDSRARLVNPPFVCAPVGLLVSGLTHTPTHVRSGRAVGSVETNRAGTRGNGADLVGAV